MKDDIIIYTCNNAISDNKKEAITSAELSNFYASKYGELKVNSEVVSISETRKAIKEKLTKKEVYILNKYINKVF